MSPHKQDLEGAACADLPPQAIERYFHANFATQQQLAEVAVRICANCPVIQQCFDQALNGSFNPDGITAGMSAYRIRLIRQWHRYDLGLSDKEPVNPRPEPAFPSIENHSAAMDKVTEYRRQADLSFEERVYEVFIDIREQKITKINDAIGKIGLIHAEFVERES